MSENIKFLDRNPPQIPLAEIERLAAEGYGLRGEFTPLESERDQNYRIRQADGSSFVFKLSNAKEQPGVIDFQTQALRHIAQQDSSLPVPRVRLSKDDQPFQLCEVGGDHHLVHVLSYLPGMILGEAPATPTLWYNIGQMAGRLDLALRGFFHPKARHELLWDMTRCLSLQPHIQHITDVGTRRNAEVIFEQMATTGLPRLKRMRHQVIHADLHGHNLLVDPAQPDRMAGVLDFGDMTFGPQVIEVAIATGITGMATDQSLAKMQTVVQGYDGMVPLEEEEINLIYDLILTRLATTTTIVAWRKAMTPDQPAYLLKDEATYWESIANIMSIGRGKARDHIRRACSFPPYVPRDQSEDLPDQTSELLARRHKVLGKGLALFYDNPVHIERGQGAWLYDAQGKAYVDAYNNVPVVGHCHPHVVKAVTRQTAALNTNTRYLYRAILDYSEKLVDTFPGDLSVCIFVNSGSEANDIAWRIAQFISGQRGAVVLENAYHGITEAIKALSPYDPKPLAPHVQTLQSPDPYRGPYRHGEPDLVERYAADADRAIVDLAAHGMAPAAFMIDSTFLSNGAPDVPEGYLAAVTAKVRAAGGLLIADEVQAGFGRLGEHLWGYMSHGLTPDLVTLGKPVGNGYPLGVVVTRPEILTAFVKETGLFSTFGGNPVACAAGKAVLEVIEHEDLLTQAQDSGEYLRAGLRELMPKHSLIGDVRGRGLLAAVELVRDRSTLEPADTETKAVLNLLRDNGVLVGKAGPNGNVLKIRPPLAFQREHADILIEALDRALAAL